MKPAPVGLEPRGLLSMSDQDLTKRAAWACAGCGQQNCGWATECGRCETAHSPGHEAFELSRRLYQAPITPSPIVGIPNVPRTEVTVCEGGFAITRRDVTMFFERDWS